MDKYQHLKKIPKQRYKTINDETWTLDNLRDGFQYFFDLYKHHPTLDEIDRFEYLPSVKTIQRKFGGIVELRKTLGLSGPTDFTRGFARASKSAEADDRAKKYEEEFFNFLISRIPEIRVHEHKIIRPAYVQSDFFVYTNEKTGVVIDLFYAQNTKTAMKVVNIKTPKYLDVQFPVIFLLVGNEVVTQDTLDELLQRKKTPLPAHIKLFTESEFKEHQFYSYFPK